MAGAYPSDGYPPAVALGDLDGDDDRDLVFVSMNSDYVSVLLNAGDATFAPGIAYRVGGAPTSVAIADLDGDGDPDLAVTNETSDDLSILLSRGCTPPCPGDVNGDGIVSSTDLLALLGSWQMPGLGDFNGDGTTNTLDMMILLANWGPFPQ